MKTMYLLIILCLSICMNGCSKSIKEMKLENTPESVAFNFAKALYQGDLETAKKLERRPFDSPVKQITRKWKDWEICMHILQKENQNMKLSVENVSKNSYGYNNSYVTLNIKNFVNINDWTRERGEGKVTLKVHKDSRDDQWIVIDIM